ncbi:hypothetical protein ATCV1_Z201L [Acanthocystis turfacea chlorella virus 1]|uniref:Uncharacterized protein Z201L n=1 Tax=Chlorovirus heliozoae TaxID=322019 RepID=A7K8G1_9PHYC|nr:hypothetical protein ATCV1_Z201L [Acanthocystis turfacea chlorella virus 1]ABT16335.1 hypothetical protein ATCV1_Z201L [Acanthocystis turfacea chlorella virus 1]
MVYTISGSLYTCDCGYKTISKDCASKHSKTKKCQNHTIQRKETHFVIGGTETTQREDVAHKKEAKWYEEQIQDQNVLIKRLRKSIEKLTDTMPLTDEEGEDEDISGDGIIYYITDKDLPTRGKIGRTKNTDVKKLKMRYSTFGKPTILCFYAEDIKKAENDLKKVLKEQGCMDGSMGKETIFHNNDTMRIFNTFVNSTS